jgi:endonuclease I
VNVDKDLNHNGYIIGYYDGQSMDGTWDQGNTYNREHTWPQSKGADKGTPMGYDMQSVRPASTAINSDRGSTPYGEGSQFYDPNGIAINNSLYAPEHLGSYRGDCARVILYDYVVYGEAGGHKNDFYLGNAQLLSKFGKNGIFESVGVLLKWHMQDPSSLTEMVRNDGAQTYQGNRNPFIDYPELAIQMLKDQVTSYPVSVTGAEMWPAYSLTLNTGFIAYMGTKTSRPEEVTVTGADYEYDNVSGRLIITKVNGAVTISVASAQALEMTEDGQQALKTIHNGQIVIIKNGKAYTILGAPVGDIR